MCFAKLSPRREAAGAELDQYGLKLMNTGTLTPSSVLGRKTKLSIRFPSKLGTFTFSATTSVYTSLESRSRYTDGGTAPRCTGGRRSDPGSSPSTHPARANVSKANAVNHARDMKGRTLGAALQRACGGHVLSTR